MSAENPGKIVSLDAERLKRLSAQGSNRDLENIETRVHPEPDDPKPYEAESGESPSGARAIPPEHFTFTYTMAALRDIRRYIETQGIDVTHKLNLLDGIEGAYKASPEIDGRKDCMAGLEAVEKAQKLFW